MQKIIELRRKKSKERYEAQKAKTETMSVERPIARNRSAAVRIPALSPKW